MLKNNIQPNIELLNAAEKSLRNRVISLENEIETYLINLGTHTEVDIEVLTNLLCYSVRPIYRYIDQLINGSFINGIGQQRRNRNPVLFKTANDFKKFIENQIQLCEDYFRKASDIIETYKLPQNEETDKENGEIDNKKDSWDGWSFDANLDNEIADELNNLEIEIYPTNDAAVDLNIKQPENNKIKPIYETYNGSRKIGHVCNLFELQEKNTIQIASSHEENKKNKNKFKKVKKSISFGCKWNGFTKNRKDDDQNDFDGHKNKILILNSRK